MAHVLYFYNLGASRDPRQVCREVEALLSVEPLGVGLVEAIGYRLPHQDGTRLIRDLSTPGRANVAAYVNPTRLMPVGTPAWTDCHETWPRTEHPGTHPPRSILRVPVGPVQWVVAQSPPQHTANTLPAQQEVIDKITRLMGPWRWKPWAVAARRRPRVATADWNRAPSEEGPGPTMLARRIGGHVVGGGIDCAVIRRVEVQSAVYVKTVNGVRLRSDHKRGALQVRFRLT